MMKRNLKFVLYILGILSLITCKVPYNPPAITAVSNYLVVEGLINIIDSTYIKLSRTVNITSASTIKSELKAVVTIESNAGNTYTLTELGKGIYAAPPLNLISTNQYRLRVKTSDGKQYVSDFNDTKVSPPIDSLSFQATTDLKIYVNTHDPKNLTRYYRWNFTETWEFNTNYNSQYVSDGLHILIRTPAQQIFDCYTSDTSSTIALGTSIQLDKDVINQALINTILPDAEKIGKKYSILVKQYALTKDAYDYWTSLKKNTEQLGSIFDSQPSASIGNIHSTTNPNEVVIGYISAGTITSSRIFIVKKSQLPNWLTTPFYPVCDADSLDCCVPFPARPPTTNQFVNYNSSTFQGYQTLQIAITPINFPNGLQKGWLAAYTKCVDCTLRGSKTPPAYWK
jgi:hypothetical protein